MKQCNIFYYFITSHLLSVLSSFSNIKEANVVVDHLRRFQSGLQASVWIRKKSTTHFLLAVDHILVRFQGLEPWAR